MADGTFADARGHERTGSRTQPGLARPGRQRPARSGPEGGAGPALELSAGVSLRPPGPRGTGGDGGPGMPAGDLFRRFWLPVLLAEELPAPDCPPLRLKILGESLVEIPLGPIEAAEQLPVVAHALGEAKFDSRVVIANGLVGDVTIDR